MAAGDEALTRFANSEIHQNVAERDVRINLRFVRGKRVGVASSGRTERMRCAASSRRRADRRGRRGDAGLGRPAGRAPERAGGRSPAAGTAEASPELRADGVRAVIAAADRAGVTAFGSFATGVETVAIATTQGIRAAESRTRARLVVVTMGPDDGTGYAEAASVDATRIDAAAVGREAAEKARRSARPVVFARRLPRRAGGVRRRRPAGQPGLQGFSALAVEEGRSFFEPGRRIGSDLVTLVDDARTRPACRPRSTTRASRRAGSSMVEAGVCREIVHDARRRRGPAWHPPGTACRRPTRGARFRSTRRWRRDTPAPALLGGLHRGLVVTRFHYTNVVHPKLAVITGMTRDGTFLVRDGEIVGPVRNLRFTQSYLDALAGVEAVSAERRLLRGELGAVLVPAVRIASWRFTGATSAH